MVSWVRKELQDILPEATPMMKRFNRILSLMGNGGDPAKFVRKMSQEPRVQLLASEIVAQLGEITLSRGVRAAFGLPAPMFDRTRASTVTEDGR